VQALDNGELFEVILVPVVVLAHEHDPTPLELLDEGRHVGDKGQVHDIGVGFLLPLFRADAGCSCRLGDAGLGLPQEGGGKNQAG
jgi:hypothetical protein